MPQTPALARLLPIIDAWFDACAFLLAAQRSIVYAALAHPDPAGSGRHAHGLPRAVPDGWRDTSAGA